MKLLARLLFLFIVVPLVELVLLLYLAKATSPEFTLLLVLGTGILGAWLAKQQGLAAFNRIREDLRRGQMPAGAVVDAVLILVAGALLLTPGVLTDALGLSLLAPPIRRRYKEWLVEWFKSRFQVRRAAPGESGVGRTQVIDSYVVEGSQSESPSEQSPPRDQSP